MAKVEPWSPAPLEEQPLLHLLQRSPSSPLPSSGTQPQPWESLAQPAAHPQEPPASQRESEAGFAEAP